MTNNECPESSQKTEIDWLLSISHRQFLAWKYISPFLGIAFMLLGIHIQRSGDEIYFFRTIPLSWFLIISSPLIIAKGLITQFAKKSSLQMCEDGLSDSNLFIKWNDIDRLYINQKLTGLTDERLINVLSLNGSKWHLDVDTSGISKDRRNNSYLLILRTIISHVAQRQWNEFRMAINSGKSVAFSAHLTVSPQGIITNGYNKAKSILPYSNILSVSLPEVGMPAGGFIILQYRDENKKEKSCIIGQVESTANIHILLTSAYIMQ